MRFSPVILAVLTASAAFSAIRPVEAQTVHLTESEAADPFAVAANVHPAAQVDDVEKLPTVEQLSQSSTVRHPQSGEILSQASTTPSPEPTNPTPGPQAQPDSNPAPAPDSSTTPASGSTPSAPEQPTLQPAPESQPAPQAPSGSETPSQPTPDQFQFGQPAPGLRFQEPAVPTEPSTQPGETPGQPSPGETPGQTPTPGETPVTPGETPGQLSPSQTSPDQTSPSTTEAEPRVLVAEVLVTGAGDNQQLLDAVYRAIRTRPGQTTTRSQLQQDINAVFATGYFSNVRAVPSDTALGVRVTFEVQPNPVLRTVQLQGNSLQTINYQGKDVPVQQAIDSIFADQYGSILNLRDFQRGIEQLNKLYQDNGYVLAQIVSAPQVAPDGTVTLEVAEGVVEDIQIHFQDKDGQSVDDRGRPIRGRTRSYIITREFTTKPGDVFNQRRIQADLQRAYNLGIFEDLQISLNPGQQDPRKVDVVVNVTERKTGSLGASAGISTSSGIFGAVSLQEQNLGGNDQTLNAEVQVGQRDLLFDLGFTDPWIGGDPNHTSYTLNAFGRQSLSLVFDGGKNDIELPNGDRPRIRRFGGGISFSRPLPGQWFASLGLQYQNVSVVDVDGVISPRDEFGTLLSYHDSGTDNLLELQFAILRDLRNNPLQATRGSYVRLSTEQSIPIDGITFNRIRGSYSYFLPVRFIRFSKGCQQRNPSASDCPQALAFNVQAGTIIGDFPPYEAFVLGGADSVRGYAPGDLGSGSSFFQATAEYRFPLISVVGGALFFDFGTNLGTGSDVSGDPSGTRDLPGTGFGYGVGIRVQSPLGQIRVDYAINDQGDSRFEFGIGERF